MNILNKLENQKILLVLAAVNTAFFGLLSIPFIARGFSAEALSVVTLVLLINSLYGVLDILRPVYVSYFVRNKLHMSWLDIIVPSMVVGIFSSFFIYVVINYFLIAYFDSYQILCIGITYLAYIFYTGLWGALDLNGLVGKAVLIKSIGTSIVYFSFACYAFSSSEINPVYPLMLGHLAALILFYMASRKLILNKGYSIKLEFFLNSLQTLIQNFSKIFIDFIDRALIAKVSSVTFVSLYNISYDLSSRGNIPSQLTASYFYPQLCRDGALIQKFLNIGLKISALLLFFAIGIYLFGERLLAFYAGNLFEQNVWVFSLMLILVSNYSLAFFSQASLRAIEDYSDLSKTYTFPAAIGALLIYPLYLLFDLKGVFIAAFILKTPGYWGYIVLRAHVGRRMYCFYTLCALQIILFLVILLRADL